MAPKQLWMSASSVLILPRLTVVLTVSKAWWAESLGLNP